MAASPIIDSLREKIGHLVGENRRLKKDNEKAAARCEKLRAQNENLTERITRLEERLRVLEIKGAVEGVSGDTKAARARVNRLLREVDKCIALLNR